MLLTYTIVNPYSYIKKNLQYNILVLKCKKQAMTEFQMDKKIIVLSGKQFCGKDTVAKILLQNFKNFKRVGLGDAIKIEFGESKGLSFEEVESNKSKYRAELQSLGNSRRNTDSNYWIKKIIDMPEDIIVPDIRALSEYEYFNKAGAFKIRVNASKESRAKRGTLSSENDITETALDNITNWDYVIANDGTYEDLLKNTEELVEKLKVFFNL